MFHADDLHLHIDRAARCIVVVRFGLPGGRADWRIPHQREVAIAAIWATASHQVSSRTGCGRNSGIGAWIDAAERFGDDLALETRNRHADDLHLYIDRARTVIVHFSAPRGCVDRRAPHHCEVAIAAVWAAASHEVPRWAHHIGNGRVGVRADTVKRVGDDLAVQTGKCQAYHLYIHVDRNCTIIKGFGSPGGCAERRIPHHREVAIATFGAAARHQIPRWAGDVDDRRIGARIDATQ